MLAENPRGRDQQCAGVCIQIAIAGELPGERDHVAACVVGLSFREIAQESFDGWEDAHPVSRRAVDLAIALACRADVGELDATVTGGAFLVGAALQT
jgi:hypothetical protein